jgi:hypothetical protein
MERGCVRFRFPVGPGVFLKPGASTSSFGGLAPRSEAMFDFNRTRSPEFVATVLGQVLADF